MLKSRPTHPTTATTTLWLLSWDSRWAASIETSSLLVVLNFRTPPSMHLRLLLRPTFPEIVLIATKVTIHWLKSYILDLPWSAIHTLKIFFFRPISIPFRDSSLHFVIRHFQHKSSQYGAGQGEASEGSREVADSISLIDPSLSHARAFSMLVTFTETQIQSSQGRQGRWNICGETKSNLGGSGRWEKRPRYRKPLPGIFLSRFSSF